MKRIFVLSIIMFLVVIGLSSMGHTEPLILQAGDVAFKLNDVTFFDDPLLAPGQDLIPDGTGSGRVCGVANITTIHRLLGGNIENPILESAPIWSASSGDYFQVRFGGLIQSYHVQPGPNFFPIDVYFVADSDTDYLSPEGNAYIQVYHRTVDAYEDDYEAGPGDCKYGSFGENIATGGTLWLDLKIQEGVLSYFDPVAGLGPDLLPHTGDEVPVIEKATAAGLTTSSSLMYATIIGGTAASQFQKGVFPLFDATWGTELGEHRADIRLKTNLTAMYDSTAAAGTRWYDEYGWTSDSDDPVTGRVGEEEEPGQCRMTGGTKTDIGEYIAGTYAEVEKNLPRGVKKFYTTGGQVGAPNANDPSFGEWTHRQHSGLEGSFTFHAGTHSAPSGTEISSIACEDPGWCVKALCAPFKQIYFDGIGSFKNVKGFNAGCVIAGETLHYFRAHGADFGEPGNNGKQKNEANCEWVSGGLDIADVVFIDAVLDDKFGDKGGYKCDECPDFYEIEIHCTTDPASPVIYSVADFIDGGNFQVHPEVGQQCP